MKSLYLALGSIFLLAGAAHADISDSGNEILGGTMTVQGNAFSVGGSTFSVASGSITLGGVLNTATVGIKWADGSTSTTAASEGGGLNDGGALAQGLAFLAGSTLSIRVGAINPICMGGGVRVSSGRADKIFYLSIPLPAAVSSTTFFARIVFISTDNAPANQLPFMTFNQDQRSLYGWGGTYCNSGCSGVVQNDNTAYAINLQGFESGNYELEPGKQVHAEVEFETAETSTTLTGFYRSISYQHTATFQSQAFQGFKYNGSAGPTSIDFFVNHGLSTSPIGPHTAPLDQLYWELCEETPH